ncbi:MAG: amidohydrolase [Opitutus sp.]|nr:amidohydrolase [Opitutus sp.]
MIIDSHVHLYPSELNADPAGWAAAHGEGQWVALSTRRRADGRAVQAFPSVGELLREMDRAEVARAVLLGWYWEKPESCAWQNRFYAECVRAQPQRLAAFAALQPLAGRAATLEEMTRAQGEGLIGVGELSPHSQGYGVDDPVFRAVLEQAGQWKLPVNLHVTDPEGRAYPGRVETPLADFVRLAREHPTTTFVLAHWGGMLPRREAGANKLENIYFDTAASPLLYGADVWRKFLELVPAKRVLFGSDYPLNLYPKLDAEPTMGRLIAEAKANGVSEAVLGGNAERLFWQ